MAGKPPLVSQSTLTGLAGLLFAAGVVLLFAAMYQQSRGALLVTALSILVLAVGSWVASAYAAQR